MNSNFSYSENSCILALYLTLSYLKVFQIIIFHRDIRLSYLTNYMTRYPRRARYFYFLYIYIYIYN